METITHTFKLGDPVSYSFNGDSYPDGRVEHITKKFLTTTTGRKFFLKTIEGRVYNELRQDYMAVTKEVFVVVGGGSWVLIKGHVFKQNPEL